MPRPIELDRESATPLWLQLYQILRAQILSGEIGPDRKIEAQESLMDRLGIARGTASRALGQLQADGLVVWTKGKGLYAADAATIGRVRKASKH